MLVKDVIKGMEAGTITGKQLSEQYAISTRTISNKIKKLGYVYDNTNKTYTFIGDDLETAENTDFGHLFRQNQRIYDATLPAPKPIKQITDKPKQITKPKPKETAPVLDAIDKLLMPVKDKPERIYRGYYFDADLLAIIDKSDNKSALINECIRAVFKQKGLL